VFSAALSDGMAPLVVVALVFSAVAAFFYLRVIVVMYMQEPQGDYDRDDALTPRLVLVVPAVVTIALGVFPGLIVGILEQASVLKW